MRSTPNMNFIILYCSHENLLVSLSLRFWLNRNFLLVYTSFSVNRDQHASANILRRQVELKIISKSTKSR